MGSAALTTDPAAGGHDRDDARRDDDAPADGAPVDAPPVDRDALAADLRPLVGDEADALADALAADLREVRARRAPAAGSPADLDLDRRTGGVCYVDRYADDLRGLAARVPYLRELGLTHLHVTPVAAPADDDTDDLLAPGVRVRPGLGSAADLADLADALHDAGLTLAVDLSSGLTDASRADRIRSAAVEAVALAASGADVVRIDPAAVL
ncbi:alpha-amylase family glycosyl hydrolase, partial [Clavibacter zhangzhiyongii]|uniref:alpha-amylase family glycosyl hydrolase n=1 Tax=Clavibacter zhangzhiyongii TaxID=2768071 RepID=UPI0022A76AF7